MPDDSQGVVGDLILNLERYVRLSGDDRRALTGLKAAPLVDARARGDIVREGDNPTVVRLVVEGWACRYKDLPDGRRQIVGFFIPGDFCDLNVYILQAMDHSIGAITPVKYLAIPPEMLESLTEARPRVAQALLWHELVNNSIQREWLLNIGARSALERMAHLLVELFVRLRAIGKAEGNSCHFPLIQSDLADATGITPVHVNRTLQELRREGLIELRAKRLKILDFERLMRLAMFNPNYLHLDHEGRHLDAND
ncbi:MAG: Crp/Fnr family transcriptional regulator [Cypionkella sp.]